MVKLKNTDRIGLYEIDSIIVLKSFEKDKRLHRLF